MAPATINILISTFPGLGLPPTLSLPVSSSDTVADVISSLSSRLPSTATRLILTTNSNKELSSRPSSQICSYLSSSDDSFLPLRLSVPLCGGKGGFGSQLRAAGGRMASRKKRNQAENIGSLRNLDGRRLRTVAEAKALAEYLAIKPEMDKREKEERRKRWEAVVDMAEKKQEEIKNGSGKSRLDGAWVDAKDEAAEKTREDVLKALKAGEIKDVLGNTESDVSGSGTEETGESESEDEIPAEQSAAKQAQSRSFFGWDEDEDISDDEEEENPKGEDPELKEKGKSKA